MTTRNLVIALKLTADGKVASGQVNDLEKNVDRLGDTAEKTGKRTRQTARDIDRMGRDSAQAAGGLKGLWRELMSVKGVLAGLGISLGSLGLVSTADDFSNLTSQIKLVTASQQELLAAQDEAFQISQRTQTQLGSTTALFTRLTRSTDELGVSQARILGLTETINQTFAISGTAAVNQANAVTQLTQAFAGGVLRAEEFNSVIENAPRLAEALAAGMGVGIGGLRAQVNAGLVTVERMVTALEGQASTINQEFGDIPLTVGRAFTTLNNSVIDFVGKADQGIGLSRGLAEAIAALGNNLDVVVDSATALAVVMAGPLVASLARATYGFVAQQLAGAALAKQLTGISVTATIASRSLALLGGPLGVALSLSGLAALSLFRSSSQARDEQQRLAEAINVSKEAAQELSRINFGNLAGISKQSLQSGLDQADTQLGALLDQEEIVSRRIEQLKAKMLGGFGGGVSSVLKLRELTSELTAVRGQIEETLDMEQRLADAMRRALTVPAEAAPVSADMAAITKAINAEIAALNEGAQAFQNFQREQKMAAEVAKLAKDATDQERASIAELVAQLFDARDAHEAQIEAQDAAAKSAEKAAAAQAKLSAEIARLRTEALSPEQQAMAELQSRISTLSEGVEDGLISEAEATALAERFTRAYWGKVLSDTREAVDEFDLELERIAARQFDDAKKFTLSLGLDLDDADIKDLTKAFEGIDAIAGMFDGIGDSGEAAIQKIAQASKSFAAAAKADGDEAFGVYLRGSAQAVAGVQQFAESGSQAYKRLGVVVSALNTVSAIQAILNQGAGDPYTAFFRMAAMAAAVGSLGIQVGGAFGGVSAAGPSRLQQTQGTGTVLGDPEAKSESILNAVEISAEAAEQLVGINTEMLRSLRTLEGAVGNVGGLVLRTGEINTGLGVKEGTSGEFGYGLDLSFDGSNSYAVQTFRVVQGTLDAIFGDDFGFLDELFGKVFSEVAKLVGGKTKILDEGIRIVGGAITDLTGAVLAEAFVDFKVKKNFLDDYDRKRNTQPLSDEVSRQFQLIFEGIVDSTLAAATALGLDEQLVRDRLAALELDDIEISTRDLSGDALANEISAVFSAVFDDVAEAIVPMITEFQRVGEGAAETLVRMATNVEAVRRQFETLDINLPASGVIGRAAAATAIVDATGGLEGFFGLTNDYMELVLTETERMDALRANVGRALESLLGEGAAGLVPTSREEVQALISGFEVVDEASAATFASLLSLVPAFEELIDFTDKQTEATLKLSQAYEQAIANIGRTRTDLARSALSPAAQVSDTLAEFQSLATRAGNAEGEELVALADQLNRLGVDLVALSRQTFASGGQTPQILALVDSVLADLQERLGDAQESLDYEAESVNLLQQIRDLIAQQNQLNAQAASGVVPIVEGPPAKPGVGAAGTEVPPPSNTRTQEVAAQQPLIIEIRGEDSRLIRRQVIEDMRRESRNGRVLIDSRGVGRVE